ncbi:MAG TPA: hypothetical protein PKC98_24990, partial [Candidatus Melainabacteria bacterium]|nr:hypothetical protein [Candidatus Melainabacteria bacterium]
GLSLLSPSGSLRVLENNHCKIAVQLLDRDAVVPYGLIYLSRTTYHFEQETTNDLDRFQLKGLAQ